MFQWSVRKGWTLPAQTDFTAWLLCIKAKSFCYFSRGIEGCMTHCHGSHSSPLTAGKLIVMQLGLSQDGGTMQQGYKALVVCHRCPTHIGCTHAVYTELATHPDPPPPPPQQQTRLLKHVWLLWFPSFASSIVFVFPGAACHPWIAPLIDQEDSLLALTVVICSDFATHHRRHFDFFPPFVHFREPYLCFLVPGCQPGLKRA